VWLPKLHPAHARDDARLDRHLGQFSAWVRIAVEFRHPSWVHDEVFGLFERRHAAYVVTSGAGLPCVLRATSDTVYVRLHGPDPAHLYGGSYSDDDMAWWAERIGAWDAQGRDVYACFNNDGDSNAVQRLDAAARHGRVMPRSLSHETCAGSRGLVNCCLAGFARRPPRHASTMQACRTFIRDLPDNGHAELQRRAAARGQSLQQYLAAELTRLACTPPLDEMRTELAAARRWRRSAAGGRGPGRGAGRTVS
jgi:plasmid stability protein